MTVKKFIALTTAIFAVTATAYAQLEVDVVSAYVFRGGTLSDEVNVQPGFGTTAFDGKVSVGTWGSFDTDESEFIEIDYFFGIEIPTGDSPVSAEIGYTEYTYPGFEDPADREPYLMLGFGDASLTIYYGIDGGIDGDLYIELGYGYSMEIVENTSLDLSAALGYLSPDEGDDGLSHLTLNAGTTLAVPESDYSVTLGVSYVVETDDDVQEVDEEVYATVGFVL